MAHTALAQSTAQGGSPPKVDPNVRIPDAVRRAAEAADKMYENTAPTGPGEPQDAPPANGHDQEARPQDGPVEPPTGRETAPQPEPRLEPAQPVTPKGDDDPNSLTFQQRWNSERGRNEKLRREVDELADRLNHTQGLLAQLSSRAPAGPAPEPPKFEEYLTPEQRAEWSEMLPVAEGLFKEQVAPLKAELERKIKEVDEKLSSMSEATQQDARSRLFQALDNHPAIGRNSAENSWRIINDSDEFKTWLKQVDRRSGLIYHKLLINAFEENDAARVASFFEDFAGEMGGAPQASRPAIQPSQAPQTRGPQVPLEALAAPGKPRSAPPPSGPQPKTSITNGDIEQLFDLKRKGYFKGRDDDFKKAEAEVFAAQAEGRLVTGRATDYFRR